MRTPIERLRPGDEVLTVSPEGSIEPRKVLRAFSLVRESIYTLTLSNGSIIRVSGEHPFWVERSQSYVEVRDLRVGDQLSLNPKAKRGAFDESRVLVGIRSIQKTDRATRVHNIEVEGNHNYFAADALVHNKQMACVEEADVFENQGQGNCTSGSGERQFCTSNGCEICCTCQACNRVCVSGPGPCTPIPGLGMCTANMICTGPSSACN